MGNVIRRTKLPPTVTARLFDQPLAIDAATLDALLATDLTSLGGFGARTSRNYLVAESVAVVPMVGTMMPRGTGSDELDAILGIVALDQLRGTLAAAAADPLAEHIVLQIDSGGGAVAGMFDFADFVAKVNAQKPITAYAHKALSAAYLVASAAGRIVLSQTDPVGNVGVMGVRKDVSAQDAADGVAYHFVTSGGAKGDGFEHKPVTDAELARLTAEVDDMAGRFYAAVGSRRPGLTAEAVRGFEAGVLKGQAAVDAKFADQVATFEDTLMELATRPRSGAVGAAPQRRGVMAEDTTKVAAIADHPDFKKLQADTRDEERKLHAERASRIGDLCILAGKPEQTGELIASDKTVDEISKWAVAERATASTAVHGVNGTLPAVSDPNTGPPVLLDITAIFAKRRAVELAASAAHKAQLH